MQRKFSSWFKGLSRVAQVGVIMGASFVALTGLGAAMGPSSPTTPAPQTLSTQPASKPKIKTKTETSTVVVPYTTTAIQSAGLAKGTTKVSTVGVNGVKTQVWTVTYTNNKQTNKVLASERVTTQPINEVIQQGTYVVPAPPTNCPNGTYTNTAGNIVCSPYSAPSAPSGATARCGDGTYSFSQSRSGTCSHHGGVAEWL
ncbi:MAG TPA: DUF3761 domain-containing protein [Patescibacteria group bacterium]|nr:DUF3761 domain-containing protein [Patescibacteria group bacterium]